jgi:hypothetical protein
MLSDARGTLAQTRLRFQTVQLCSVDQAIGCCGALPAAARIGFGKEVVLAAELHRTLASTRRR